MEDLGRGQPSPQVGGDRRDHRVVDFLQPLVGRDDLRHRPAFLLLQVGAEAGDVVQQAAGLVLAHVQPGPEEQLPAAAPGLGDPGPYPQPVALRRADQLDLLGVETEVVEPAQPLGDPVPLLVRAEYLLPGELVPQPVVAPRQLLGDLQRVDVGRQQVGGLQVEQLAEDPLDGQIEVIVALAIAQLRMLLTGLRVDQVGLQRARVIAEQRVGQRAVPPEEARQVQPHQQLDQGIEQPVGRLAAARAGEDGPVGRRVRQELGHQDRVAVRAAVHRDADHLDGGNAQLGQGPQQPVLAPREPLVDLLERVQRAVVHGEPDDVPRDPALPDLDQPLVLPGLQRLIPRQGQQPGSVLGRGGEHKAHVSPISAGPSASQACSPACPS